MKYNINNTNITTFSFEATQGSGNASTEHHIILQCEPSETFQEQNDNIFLAFDTINDGRYGQCLFIRFFVSDASNQSTTLHNSINERSLDATVSIIQQPPLDGSKIAAWCYFATNMEISSQEASGLFSHNGYHHTWSATNREKGNAYEQTYTLLEEENAKAKRLGMSLADNCIRTWFYVQNIDVNYQGMVVARKELFDTFGLTNHTHYIASTGIEGRSASPASLIRLDSYLVKGLKAEQIQYLHALSHLNPTYEYGVTFERATAVHYGDRKHIFLSGTASIDNKGNILHIGDIKKQTLRMWENCEALLSEAGSSLNDMAHMFIYLRDIADYQTVHEMFEKRFPDTPKLIVLAPVCRPGWLIEMEGIAITGNREKQYANF